MRRRNLASITTHVVDALIIRKDENDVRTLVGNQN